MTDNIQKRSICLTSGPSFSHQDNNTILETLEQHDYPIEYHCREGFCGACRVTLLAGEVEYVIDPLAFIDDDEILPCCCKPLTDIEVKL